MVQDIVHNLCESLVENIGGVTGIGKKTPPTPITYLTQWKIVGNSEVHTDEYLTQWKVEGNSVVDNNTILSCGDLGQDGKYHVKISNGVTIYDIPLTEPLRKVNDVADSIEFVNGVATLTRLLKSVLIGNLTVVQSRTNTPNIWRWILKVGAKVFTTNILNTKYVRNSRTYYCEEGINADSGGDIQIFDSAYTSANDKQAFIDANADVEIIFELATPTTEVIQVSPFPVSPTDTYTSANDTPYSAFEYKKNVEIWSCGEYSAVDNKWHIRILPEGYGIVDIALDEPLRMISDDADSIEFVNGVGTLTRHIKSVKWNELTVIKDNQVSNYDRFRTDSLSSVILLPVSTVQSRTDKCLSADFVQDTTPINKGTDVDQCMAVYNTGSIYIRDTSVNNPTEFQAKYGTHEFLYRLATPTTETIQAPQIEEAESYSCVISQGGKAVEWSGFETE